MNDHSLDRQVASLAPITDEDIKSASLATTAAQLRTDIMKTPVPPPLGREVQAQRPERTARRRRPARVAALAALVALAMTATAAAAIVMDARTGLFGGGEGTEDGSGEFIRLDAPGASGIVDELGADIPLPPGGNFARLKSTFLRPSDDGAGVIMSESGITGVLALEAACQWTGYWLDGFHRGDSAQQAKAQQMLDEIPTWKVILASDAGGLVDQLRRRAEGARASDPARFMQDYQINCTGELSPVGN